MRGSGVFYFINKITKPIDQLKKAFEKLLDKEDISDVKIEVTSSDEIADYLLEDVGVVVLPGNNFGKFGEGFIRMCYAASKPDISEAITRIKSSIGKLNSK